MGNEIVITDSVVSSVNRTENSIIDANTKNNTEFIINYSHLLTSTLQEIKNPLIDAYILNNQRKFHEDLKWFQKYIPFVKTGEIPFQNKIRFKTNLMNYGFEIGIQLIDILNKTGYLNNLKNRFIDYPKIFKTLIEAYLYVNNASELERNAFLRFKGILDRHEISKSSSKIDRWINESIQKNDLNFNLPKWFHSNMQLKAIFIKSLCKLSDTEKIADRDSDTYKRLFSLATDYLGLSTEEFNLIISSSINENFLLSSVIEVTQYSINEFLEYLINNVSFTNQRINLLIDSDPLKVKRDSIKKGALKTGSLFAAGGLTLLTGPVGDFLIATAGPLLVNSFDTNDQIVRNEITNRYNEIMLSRRKSISEISTNKRTQCVTRCDIVNWFKSNPSNFPFRWKR